MKILILGGTRFFGKKAAEILFEKGHELSILSRGQIPIEPQFFSGDAPVKWLKGDRNNLGKLKAEIANNQYDVVIDQCCYTASEAQLACEEILPYCNRLIFTSTECVYAKGLGIKEEDFDSSLYEYSTEASKDNYPEAKKQAEAVFSKNLSNEFWTALRFPVVMGQNDYTRRLVKYISAIKYKKPLYFSNLEAKFSFIHAQDAAESIVKVVENEKIHGPLNIASPDFISVGGLIHLIEEIVQKKKLLTSVKSDSFTLEYDLEDHWTMNVDKAKSFNINPRPIATWLPGLIEDLADRV